MKTKIILLMLPLKRWRLWVWVFAIICALVMLVDSAVDLFFYGKITPLSLGIDLIICSIVIPPSLYLLNYLLRGYDKKLREELELKARFANSRLNIALENSKMLVWELDISNGEIHYDDSSLNVLGIFPEPAPHDFESWLAIMHPDDRAHFMEQYQMALHTVDSVFDVKYRYALTDNQWGWGHTRGQVIQRDSAGNPQLAVGSTLNITERKLAEESIIASKERADNISNMLRLISDNVPDMIWAKDLNKRFIFANKAMCEQLLNASDTSEPLGKDDLFFALRERSSHPDDPQWHTFGELCQDSDAATLSMGKPSQFDEYGNVRGKFLFLDVRKAPFFNSQGDVIGVVGSARDVTEQKATEEKLNLASLVLQNSSEAMFATDAKNRIVDINPAFTRLTGFERNEAIGKNPNILRSGRQEPDFYNDMWQQIESSGHWQGEIWNRRKNGDVFAAWQTINTVYSKDGSVHRRVSLFSDITERKQTEESISTLNIDHERRVHERTLQLEV